MSTRSLIGIKDNKGITYVYCHFDGYLDGVGKTLVEHYDTADKIYELLENGDMSCLGDYVDECEFYKDRGEDNVDASTIPVNVPNIKDVYYECGQNCWADYVYLFDEELWYYARETAKRTEDRHGIVYDDKGEMVYAPAEWNLVEEDL